MIEANYCLNAADFADMAALRQRLTRITPILFFAAVGFGCAVAGFSARSHRPAVALAACLPLAGHGRSAAVPRTCISADVYSPVQGTSVSDCTGANAHYRHGGGVDHARRKAGSVRNSRCVPYGHVRRRI